MHITTDLHNKYNVTVIFKSDMGFAVSARYFNNFQNYVRLCQTLMRKKPMQ